MRAVLPPTHPPAAPPSPALRQGASVEEGGSGDEDEDEEDEEELGAEEAAADAAAHQAMLEAVTGKGGAAAERRRRRAREVVVTEAFPESAYNLPAAGGREGLGGVAAVPGMEGLWWLAPWGGWRRREAHTVEQRVGGGLKHAHCAGTGACSVTAAPASAWRLLH